MAYTPTTWETGDVITSQKLNKIENGVANTNPLIVTQTSMNNVTRLDRTVQQIYDAIISGRPVYFKYSYGGEFSNFSGQLHLAPITTVYHYAYTDQIRIIINKNSYTYNLSDKYYLFKPAVLIYKAEDVDEYPSYYCTVVPNNNALSV